MFRRVDVDGGGSERISIHTGVQLCAIPTALRPVDGLYGNPPAQHERFAFPFISSFNFAFPPSIHLFSVIVLLTYLIDS